MTDAHALETLGRLECRLVPLDAPAPAAPLLAEVVYGARTPRASRDTLRVDVPLPQLGSAVRELWTTGERPRLRQDADLRLASTAELTFGAISIAERDLDRDTRAVYDQLLETLAASAHPHLLRVWNVVPGIVTPAGSDLDRYMVFCRARSQTLERHHGADFAARLSAASAVGGTESRLVTYFLAGPHPGAQRANPRQDEAWRYPRRYGPRAPSFARGLAAPAPFAHTLFVSGTASIVGHESLHLGDTHKQLDETLANMGAVAELPLDAGHWTLKVYLRDAADQPGVAARLGEAFGADTPVLYLRADVCRPELAIEIEGVLRR